MRIESRSPWRVLTVCVTAGVLVLIGAAPAQAKSGRIRTPDPTIACTPSNGYVTITGRSEAWLVARPKKLLLSVDAYIKVTTEIQAQAGYNGTLWKTLQGAKKTETSEKSYYPSSATSGGPLPVYAEAVASSNAKNGLGTYRVKMKVRVYRGGPGIDGLTNTRVLYSRTITCEGSGDSGINFSG